MIDKSKIKTLVSNHTPPHIYNSGVFEPGVTPVFYSGQYWDERETEAAIDALLNGKWLVAGEHVQEFERKFSEKFNQSYTLMVNSGSSANLVMIAALKKHFGWMDDDEIIVSPAGFSTTISVIYHNRLKPVFADIEWDTLNFNLYEVVGKITPRTRAIFLSPVLGNPPNMDWLVGICNTYNLELIVDNCDSLGSKWNGKYLNEYGIASSCSLYASHHISTGMGGTISTNNSEIFKLLLSFSSWGRDCFCRGAGNLRSDGVCGKRFDKWLNNHDGIVDHKYVFSNMGYNVLPLDLQGAIGSVQIDKFDEIHDKRIKSKNEIEKIVLQIEGVRGVKTYSRADVCWFGVPFICESKELKNKIVAHFEKNKIQTRNYFAGNILLHEGFSFLEDYGNYPEANAVLEKTFFLGSAPHFTENVFKYIKKVTDEIC